jgi:hypothetical protein
LSSNVVPLRRPSASPPAKPPHPIADLWPKVQERFIKLGRYGLCGMQSEKPNNRLPKDVKDFLSAMHFIPVATPAAAARLWEFKAVCMILINIRNHTDDVVTFQKSVTDTLFPLGIIADFDQLANKHFGIIRVVHVKEPDHKIKQRMEVSDFVNARAIFLESPLRFKMLGLNQEFNDRQSFFLKKEAKGVDGKMSIIRGDRIIEHIDVQGRTNLAIGRQLL